MPQTAIQGIYQNGKIIPQEEIPFKEDMRVIIVFNGRIVPGEERYYTQDWIKAEKQATADYKKGNVKSADNLDEMFAIIERETDDD